MAGKRSKKDEFYWPLGLINYGSEIEDSFPDEVLKIGVITVLWNHHEECLRRIFLGLFAKERKGYLDEIWNRQSTHQARRNLLAMALTHTELTDHQRALLVWVIDKTKAFADRRNDLIHGVYEVHGKTSQLFARTRSPRSNKVTRQRSTVRALNDAIAELELLMQVAEELSIAMIDPDGKITAAIRESYETFLRRRDEPSPQSPQSDSPPQSDHQTQKRGRKRPPAPSQE